MDAKNRGAGIPPESDVSPWVGAAGLVALFSWIVISREWPAIAGNDDPGKHCDEPRRADPRRDVAFGR